MIKLPIRVNIFKVILHSFWLSSAESICEITMPFVNSDLGYRPNYQSAINSALNSINK
jgi:hypothetical protein